MKIKQIEYDAEFGVIVDVEGLEGYRICLPLGEQAQFLSALQAKIEQIETATVAVEPAELSAEDELLIENLKALEGTEING